MWALALEGSRQVEKHPQGQPWAHPGRDGVGRAAGTADLRLAHLFMGLPGGVTQHRPPQDQAGGGLQGRGPIRPCPPEMGASGSQPGQRGKPMGQVGCPLGPDLPGRPSCTKAQNAVSQAGTQGSGSGPGRSHSGTGRAASPQAAPQPRDRSGARTGPGGPESPPRRRAGEEGTGKASRAGAAPHAGPGGWRAAVEGVGGLRHPWGRTEPSSPLQPGTGCWAPSDVGRTCARPPSLPWATSPHPWPLGPRLQALAQSQAASAPLGRAWPWGGAGALGGSAPCLDLPEPGRLARSSAHRLWPQRPGG